MRQWLLLIFLLSSCGVFAQQDFAMSKKEIRLERKKFYKPFEDSLFNGGKLFNRHNIYFGSEGIGDVFYLSTYWNKPNYLIVWRPHIGYFPAKRLLIALRPGMIYTRSKEANRAAAELGIVFRYYAGKGRVTFFPEVAYYFTNNYHGRRGFYTAPDDNKEYRTIKHRGYVGVGLNIRVWNYLSISLSGGGDFLLKESGTNAAFHFSYGMGVNFMLPTRRFQINRNIFAKPTFRF